MSASVRFLRSLLAVRAPGGGALRFPQPLLKPWLASDLHAASSLRDVVYICVVKRCDSLKRAYILGISGSGRTLAGGGGPGGGGGGTEPGGGGTEPGGGGGTLPGGGGRPGGWA